MTNLAATLERDLAEAERKAWDALARWKFWMFGYHASDVIKIKRRLGRGREPFFGELVAHARPIMRRRYGVQIPASAPKDDASVATEATAGIG